MKKLFLVFIVGLFLSTISLAKTRVLKDTNTVTFRGVVTYKTVAEASQKLLKLSNKLGKKEVIYLVLDTPGGYISAGLEFIQMVKALPQRVITITNFAASMGFIFVQNFDNRYVLPHGTLMAHRAWMLEMGQVPGEFNVRSNYWRKKIYDMEKTVAKRLGMSLREYRKFSYNEYWADGIDCVKDKTADKIVSARCGKSLVDTYEDTIATFFGPIKVTWSKCPLITAPLKVDYSGFNFKALNNSGDKETLDMISALLYNKQEFFEKYIKTNKFKRVFK